MEGVLEEIIMKLHQCKPGMVITIPGMNKTDSGVQVARIRSGQFKSYLKVSFTGGLCYNLPRDTEVEFREKQDDSL